MCFRCRPDVHIKRRVIWPSSFWKESLAYPVTSETRQAADDGKRTACFGVCSVHWLFLLQLLSNFAAEKWRTNHRWGFVYSTVQHLRGHLDMNWSATKCMCWITNLLNITTHTPVEVSAINSCCARRSGEAKKITQNHGVRCVFGFCFDCTMHRQ